MDAFLSTIVYAHFVLTHLHAYASDWDFYGCKNDSVLVKNCNTCPIFALKT